VLRVSTHSEPIAIGNLGTVVELHLAAGPANVLAEPVARFTSDRLRVGPCDLARARAKLAFDDFGAIRTSLLLAFVVSDEDNRSGFHERGGDVVIREPLRQALRLHFFDEVFDCAVVRRANPLKI
jgi:hypothetical protein